MTWRFAGVLGLGLGVLATTAAAEPPDLVADASAQSTFKCEGGRQLSVQFTHRGSEFVAVVNAGDAAHILAVQPPDLSAAQVVWSDGVRTLVWSSGVHLMWMDGGADHLMCGGGHHH